MSAMIGARIAPIDPPYPPEVQAEFDKLMRGAPPLLLFRTVARNPRVLQRMMAGGLLDRGSISLRSRELMILRTCARCGAEYEWGVHIATFGVKARWTPAHIYSTAYGSAPHQEHSAGAALAAAMPETAELDRRLAEREANPDDVVSWDEVKASLERRL